MDFSQIESSVRTTLDDASAIDKLWTQDELLEYARDAENEACERAELIIDNSSGLTSIAINTSTGAYALSNTVTNIKSAKLNLGTKPLMKTSERVLDTTVASWRTETGTPRSYVKLPTNQIRLYPAPIVADTLQMTVARFPNTPMAVNGSPEIDARYHPGLLFWIIHRAYMKNDSETLNTGKAADYKKLFEEFFGPKVILND
jgi:hypothetical protein